MSLPSETDAMSVIEGAVGSVLGGFLLWLLTCSLAGFIATAAIDDSYRDFEWIWAFAWILHVGVAGIALWGLPVICLHGFLVSALVHGTEHPIRVLAATFVLQLTTSTIVVAMLEPYSRPRILTVWSCVALPAIGCLVLDICRAKKRRLAWEAVRAGQSRRSAHQAAPEVKERLAPPCSWKKNLQGSRSKNSSFHRRRW